MSKPLLWRDERWYRDENHQVSAKEKLAPGRDRLRRSIVAALKRHDARRNARVIEALEGCRSGHRCGSAACPDCHMAANRYFRSVLEREFGGAGRLVMTTIIPTTPATMPATFAAAARVDLRGWLQQVLADAGLAEMPAIAAEDLSFNLFPKHDARPAASYVCLHICMFTTDRDPEAITRQLRRVVERHPLVPLPVVSTPITRTPERARSYGLKQRFVEIRHVATTGTNGRLYRQEQEGHEAIEPSHPRFPALARFLHQRSLAGRIFAQNLTHYDAHLLPKSKTKGR